mgnify:CR=1 FL=1
MNLLRLSPLNSCAVLLTVLLAIPLARAQDEAAELIARVVALRGAVEIRRAGDGAEKASLKAPLEVGDVVATTRGRVQLSFTDGSIISLGSNTTIEITAYEYDPAESKAGMTTTVRQGFFRVLGGAITKIAPGNFKTHTPTATIGVRGSYFVGTATATLTRVAFLGGTGIYLENEFGSMDLNQAGDMGEAGDEGPPSDVEDPNFVGNALDATGVGGGDEDAGDDDEDADAGDDDDDAAAGDDDDAPADDDDGTGDDDDGTGSDDDQAGWSDDTGTDGTQDTLGTDDGADDDDDGLTPEDVVDPDDEVNDQVDDVAEAAPWNGLAMGLDHLGNWFETPTSDAFQLTNDPGAGRANGTMTLVSNNEIPVRPTAGRTETTGETWHLDVAVEGTSPTADMALSVDPAEKPYVRGEGLAEPFPREVAAVRLPEYLSWGEWNMDLYDPNAADAAVPQGAITGFYVTGRRTPAEIVEGIMNSTEPIVGYYYGAATAGRFKAGTASRYEGTSDLIIDFSAGDFTGTLNFVETDTGTVPLVIDVGGIVRPDGFHGLVTRLSEGATRGVAPAEIDIEESAVKGAFYGPTGPDAVGGVFRASSLDAHYEGNFVGVEEATSASMTESGP